MLITIDTMLFDTNCKVSEKNSVGFMYDISDITSPKLAQVFHLSPASETKNPIVAYADRTLGEIDSESILFLDENESPTGNPAIIFAGAFSTTTSFWEFDCGPDSTASTFDTASDSTTSESDSAKSSAFVAKGSFISILMAATIFVTL